MIYFIKNIETGRIKIGYSETPKKRLRELQTGSDSRLVIIKTIKGDLNKEKELHDKFSHLRTNGEWFESDDELLQFIKGTEITTLEGKFFHSFENDKVKWQGYVVSEPKDGYFLVQLFDWLMGDLSDQKLVKLDDMVGWSFYDSNEDMIENYEYKYRKE